jgi:hypothetical protein
MGRSRTSILIAAAAAAAGLLAAPAAAQQVSLVAAIDRDAVSVGDAFTYEVTLTFANEQVGNYQPPDFKGLQLVSAPQFPNRSTQMQFGGGQNLIQNSLSWRYQLAVPAGTKNTVTIAPARVRVNGRDMRSNPVAVHLLGASGGAAANAPAGAGAPPPSADVAPSSEAAEARGGNFIRAVPSKTRAFVGEEVVVAWYIYLAQQQNKYQPLADPHTDGFWSEDLSTGNPAGRLSFSQDTIGGRPYLVGTLLKKALFPLHAGKLTVTPLEMEVSQVDFFGGTLRTQRLKAQPLAIEAVPLPREGQPAAFAPGNVGTFTFTARADRDKVSVGEAVTVTLEIKGEGNLRNLQPPPLPPLAGWKSYEPKVTVNIEPGDTVSGSKLVEYLLLPEHAGTTTVPALELATFDPRAKAYAVLKSAPLRLEVTGDATAGAGSAAHAGGAAAGAGAGGPVENVIAAEIRPIHGRSRLSRDAGATFLRSTTPFLAVLAVPPLALGLTALAERLRERLAAESRRTRRRRVRSLARKRLGAADAHREAGRTADFYIEIDRVLREALSTRLGRSVGGLRMDELGELLRERGMPSDEAARIVAELEACDQARFAPAGDGGSSGGGGGAAMSSALERAGELIVAIQKAPLHEEARA